MRTLEEERAHNVLVDNEVKHIKKELKLQAFIFAGLLSTIWGTYLLNNVFTDRWIAKNLTILPRALEGIPGMFISPFVHLDLKHAIVCSIGAVVLGWWVMLRDTRDFLLVHLIALLTSGVAMWLFELQNSHWFGWGGILMGMIGYLMTTGFFERRWHAWMTSGAALFLFGLPVLVMMFTGAMAGSWVGCMGGLLGGALTAAFLGWRRRKEEDPEDYLGNKVPNVTEMVVDTRKTKPARTDVTFDFSTGSVGDATYVESQSSAKSD